jgi:hypothetical protein
MNQTYDPILESVSLRRIRKTAVRSPAIGTALVLERTVGEPVVVAAGDRVPDPRTGNYRTLHRVVVAKRTLGFTLIAPSSDPAFPFTVEISCGCQIIDPVPVVRDDVRDMAGALQSWLTALVRPVTVRYDALRPAEAEAEIMSRLHAAYLSDGLQLSGYTVKVTTRDVEGLVTAQRELRVQEMRRDAMRPVARGGREEMLAHVMAITDGDPTPLLDREQEAKESNTKASLLALSALMGSEKLEEFNTSRISEQVMTEFFPGGEPLLGRKRAGIRERLDRKRKAIDSASPAIDAEDPDPAPAADPARVDKPVRAREPDASAAGPAPADPKPPGSEPSGAEGERPRPSRVRGLLRREDG